MSRNQVFAFLALLSAAFFFACSDDDSDSELSQIQSESMEGTAEVSNGFGDSAAAVTKISGPAFDSVSNCSIDFDLGDPSALTLGSGEIDGSFDGGDYAFSSWDLSSDMPKALDDINKGDFETAPVGDEVCDVGDWNFSGKITFDADDGRIVRHLWRSFEPADDHNFFVHMELNADVENSAKVSWDNLQFVRERWLKDDLIMAQAGVNVGAIVSEKESSKVWLSTGKLCVHHLLAKKHTFHEFKDIKRVTGLSNFCCHPLSGTDTVSVYSDDTTCSDGKPEGTPESKFSIHYPDECGAKIKVEELDPESGDVQVTKSGTALCVKL